MSVCAEDATQRGEVCSIANHPTCSELRAPTLAQGDRGDSCVTRGSAAPLTRRRSSGPTGAGERSRGEPVVKRPSEAIARRPKSTSRGSTCASSGPCSRPAAHGTTAVCVAKRLCGLTRADDCFFRSSIVRPTAPECGSSRHRPSSPAPATRLQESRLGRSSFQGPSAKRPPAVTWLPIPRRGVLHVSGWSKVRAPTSGKRNRRRARRT
jgi:hypothetical protein